MTLAKEPALLNEVTNHLATLPDVQATQKQGVSPATLEAVTAQAQRAEGSR